MEKQRHSEKSVMKLVNQLSSEMHAKLCTMLAGAKEGTEDMDTFLVEHRFTCGRVCPICDGTQKFICRDCGKTFSITKNTIFEGTQKCLAVRKAFMGRMSEDLSLDMTAFDWRHKVLDPIGEALKGMELTGIAKADEAFLPVSYKGNKKTFEAVLGGHLSAKATLCTDGDRSYRHFVKGNGNALVRIKGGKGLVKGIYYIQHLDVYHTRLKSVFAKYLNNYLTWVNALEGVRGVLAQKALALIDHAATLLFAETSANVPNRSPLLVLVKNQSQISANLTIA